MRVNISSSESVVNNSCATTQAWTAQFKHGLFIFLKYGAHKNYACAEREYKLWWSRRTGTTRVPPDVYVADKKSFFQPSGSPYKSSWTV